MAESKMQLEDWLDDLCVRFIINLPQEDLSTVARICFQVEEAQWFYEDFIRPLDPTLPSMTLRSFCLRIFQHCPLLAPFSVENHMKAFEEFLQYKTRIPVRGAILLNEDMDATILVKGWKKGANWSFPRGKINKDEDDLECAIREVYEETGFNVREAGLVPENDEVKYIEITMRDQQLRLYVFRNVPEDTVFEPKTRKEISKIQWYKLSELPAFRKKGIHQQNDAAAASNANKFYMVAPFLVPLKKWVVQQKKKDAARYSNYMQVPMHPLNEEVATEEETGAQTDAAVESSNSRPAADAEALEGATRELQRLLKVQPPTQGLQVTPSSVQSQDKGGALLAMLQAGPGPGSGAGGASQQSMHQQGGRIPHTPLDLTYNTAPEPRTPHHHHPTQRVPFSNYDAPPSFPIQPDMNQHYAPAYTQTSQATNALQPHMPNQHASFMPPPPYRHEPVPLLHPQPLPPQVQQTLLTRGILPTPTVSDTTSTAGGPGRVSLQSTGHAHPTSHQGMVPQLAPQLRMPVPQLNSHSMSLLNAFKREDSRPEEAKELTSHETSRSTQPQPLNWAPLTSTYSAQQTRSFTTAAQGPPSQMTANGPAQVPIGQSSFKAPRASEKQRSTLLEMFKGAGPISPPQQEAQISSRETFTDSISGPRQADMAPAETASAAEAIEAAARANGGPVEMNPDLNLPFGALSILSRPKQEGIYSDHARPAQVHAPSPRQQPGQQPDGAETKAAPQLLSFSPREESITAGRSYQSLVSPPAGSSFPAPSVLQRRQDANPEQKQRLLSLFGKPQPSPTGSFLDDKGKGKDLAPFEQGMTGTPRSRVASLASASGGDGASGASMSRRGSQQAPISPADRNFLLGYLQSVSSGGAR